MASHDDPDTVARAQAALEDIGRPFGAPKRVVRRATEVTLHCVLVRTAFERRSVIARHTPAPGAANESLDEHPPALDPWSVAIAAPRASAAPTHDEHHFPEHARLARCPACGGTRKCECWYCNGAGWIETLPSMPGSVGTRTRCGKCVGTGVADCATCDRSGCVTTIPSVVVETGWVSRARAVDDGALPTDAFVDIANVELAGPVAVAERGADLSPGTAGRTAGASGGYRDAPPPLPEGVYAAIDALLAEDAVGGDHRVTDRALEVRRVPAFNVHLDNGRDAWLIGAPASVVPPDALEGHGGLLGWLGGSHRKPHDDG